MPTPTAQTKQKENVSAKPLENVTWEQIPDNDKENFFKPTIIKSASAIEEHINEYERVHNVNLSEEVTPEYIKFQHFLKTSIEEKGKAEEETENHKEEHEKHHKKHPRHNVHGEHEAREVDMLHQGIKESKNYQNELTLLKAEKAEKWEEKKAEISKKWEKDNKGKSISSKEGQEHLKQHAANPNSYATEKQAETIYRKKFKEEAMHLDQEEIKNTKSGSYARDHIGKQYQKFAAEDAKKEIQGKNLIKNYKEGKITQEEYKKQANEIYDRHRLNQDKKFAKEYKVKTAVYAKTDQRLDKAAKQVQSNTVKKYYDKKEITKEKTKDTNLGKTNFEKTLGKQTKENNATATKDRSNYSKTSIPKENEDTNKENKVSASDIYNKVRDILKQPEETIQEFTPGESFGELGTEGLTEAETAGEMLGEGLTEAEALGTGVVEAEAAGTAIAGGEAAAAGIVGAEAAAGTTAAVATAEATGGAALGFFATPPGWITLAILGVILIIVIIVISISGQSNNNQANNQTIPPVPGLTISVKALDPVTVPNGDNQLAPYEIDVTCDTTCQPKEPLNIYLDTLPKDTVPVDPATIPATDPNFAAVQNDTKFTTTPYPMTWSLPANTPTYTITFALSTKATDNNAPIGPVRIKGALVGANGSGGATTTGGATSSVPPSATDCGNTSYKSDLMINTWKVNYGDPNCELIDPTTKQITPTKIADIISQLDQANEYRWYNVIAKCESHYDANIEELQGAVDPAHAWGLFQMGRGKNGPTDHGDVYWKDQIANAINYNKNVIGGSFTYWATRNYNPNTCQP